MSDNNNPLSLSVSFNGTDAGVPTISSDTELTATVPQDATTGTISIRGDNASATSSTVFEVESDIVKITSFAPIEGPIGKRVQMLGQGFKKVNGVKFGTVRAAQWGTSTDNLMWANVPQGAATGRIYLSSMAHAPIASPLNFTVTPNVIMRTQQIEEPHATPLEQALISAWNALFQDGTLNSYIGGNFATLGLPDTNAGSVNNVDLCYVPGAETSPVPKGDAVLTLSGMSVTGLASIAPNGAPTFFANDSLLNLPATLSNLVVTGTFTVNQTCCTPLLVWCTGDFPASQSGSFTYTVPSSALTISVSVNKDAPKTSVTVNGLAFNFTSSPRVDIPNPNPSWLHWLDYVSGYMRTEEAISDDLQSRVAGAIQGSPLAGQMQTILNQALSSGSPAVVA
jgi:hypothetical protein